MDWDFSSTILISWIFLCIFDFESLLPPEIFTVSFLRGFRFFMFRFFRKSAIEIFLN